MGWVYQTHLYGSLAPRLCPFGSEILSVPLPALKSPSELHANSVAIMDGWARFGYKRDHVQSVTFGRNSVSLPLGTEPLTPAGFFCRDGRSLLP